MRNERVSIHGWIPSFTWVQEMSGAKSLESDLDALGSVVDAHESVVDALENVDDAFERMC